MTRDEIKSVVNDFLVKLIKHGEDSSEDFARFFVSLPESDKDYCVQVFYILEQYHTGAITKEDAVKEYERLRKDEDISI